MPVDRCARWLRKLETEVLEAGPEGGVVGGGELRGVTDARRERLAPAIQRYASLACVPRSAAPLPASTLLAPTAMIVRSSAIHPVRGRVSPSPSWTALPSRRPSAGWDRTSRDRGPSTLLSTKSPTAPGLVDKSRETPLSGGRPGPLPATSTSQIVGWSGPATRRRGPRPGPPVDRPPLRRRPVSPRRSRPDPLAFSGRAGPG